MAGVELFLCLGGGAGRRLTRRRRGLRRPARHAVLEAAYALAQSAHDFRNSAPAEENQNDRQNDQPMKDTELTHRNPPRALLKTAPTVLQEALLGNATAVLTHRL